METVTTVPKFQHRLVTRSDWDLWIGQFKGAYEPLGIWRYMDPYLLAPFGSDSFLPDANEQCHRALAEPQEPLTPETYAVDRRGGQGRWEEGGERGRSEAAVAWWMLKRFSLSLDVGIHPQHIHITGPLHNTATAQNPFQRLDHVQRQPAP